MLEARNICDKQRKGFVPSCHRSNVLRQSCLGSSSGLPRNPEFWDSLGDPCLSIEPTHGDPQTMNVRAFGTPAAALFPCTWA